MATLLTGTTIGGNVALHAGNYTSYPDATKLPLAGGTMTGGLTVTNLFGNANSASLYANTGDYGSWKIGGTRNGWYGIEFESGVSLMVNSTEVGFHRNGIGWQMRWHVGTGYIHKGSNGGGTQATILDSSNYTSYPDATKLPLGGGTMTGVLTTYTPGVQTSLSGLSAYNAGVNVGERSVTAGVASFVPAFGQNTVIASQGYRSHMILGSYRNSNGNWAGGPFIAWGGNDAYPTEYWLFNQGGAITHSSGTTFLNTSSTLTAGNLSGTIPSAVLGNSAHFIGTTSIALNRASATQLLAGVNIDGYANYISAQTNPIGAFNVGLTRPKGASYTTTATTVTGAIKIKMPPGTPVHGMWKMTIKIYEYGSRGNGYTIECGCHLYPSNAYNRYQYAIGVDSNIALPIRYGTDGTSGCIWIGENATTWYYPQIHVTEFSNGFNNPGSVDWSAGTWGVTIGNIDNSVAVDGPYTIGLPLASTATTAGSCTGNAATVTDGMYLSGTQTITGIKYFQSNLGTTSGTLNTPPLQAYATGTNAAFMSFHRGGNYAVNMGLDSDNVLRIGGWSAAANRLQLDMSGNLTVAGGMYASIFYDSDNNSYYANPSATSNFNELTLAGVGTSAYGLLKYGGTRSGDWQSFTSTAGQINVIQVENIGAGGHTNYPTGVYSYGAVMSWRTANHSFQLYAAHTGDLAYKTQWNNDNYSGWRRILDSSTYPHAANMNQYVRSTDSPTFVDLFVSGLQVRTASPTITLRDTDHRTGFIHVNSNIFYVLTGAADSGSGSWGIVANSRWPLEINLSNNNATFGADVNAISFTGAGTGLTGTAASLTAGAVTNGVYTTGNQTIAGTKTFSSAIVATNAAKAWVHFNGTGNVGINANYNVSSITDNGTGDYTVNFTSAFVDTNYVVAGTATIDYTSAQSLNQLVLAVARQTGAQSTGSCRLATEYIHGAALYDAVAVRAVFYR